jgi:hypothetical protein
MTLASWQHFEPVQPARLVKVATLKSAVVYSMLILSVSLLAQNQASAQTKRQPSEQQRETWRKAIVRTRRPNKGCFVATYPETKWREVPCATPPNRPYPPRQGLRPQTVGSGIDFSGQVTTNTSQAEGSFDSVSGVTSEMGNGIADSYSLQLNTNFFTTTACSGGTNNCQGWEQFVFSSSGYLLIEYWLLHYENPCPAGWNTYGVSCWRNGGSALVTPAQTIGVLGQMKLDGAVAGVNGPTDSITLSIGNTVYSAPGDNYFPDLTNGWRLSEFNVFGDCCNSEATFNPGSTIVVRTAVNSGTPAMAPTCQLEGYTGETNNLTLMDTPAMQPDVTWPSIVFTQSNAGSPVLPTCAAADSIGDTHLKTFNALMYDFQASGDFLLLKDGSDFEVQARQASGAPTWPNASVNKAVAVQMDKTRVAIYIEPTRLIIEGHSTDLPDGQALELPHGVQIRRHGNTYDVTSEHGNSVRAVLNSTWINVTVGLGHPQTHARGLLVSSGATPALITSNGSLLRTPISFDDLYHRYADGWRVQPNESLFRERTQISAGIPAKPFYADALDPKDRTRALAICKAARIRTPALLEACALDITVLKDEVAAQGFVHIVPPRIVVKPVLRGIRAGK